MLNSLTSFRFIAALFVFIFHAGFLTQYQLGAAGVSFFFVLSGFILAFNYHSKFLKLDRVSLKKFYIARFAKIYPVHVLTFIIAIPLVVLYFNPDGLYLIKFTFMSIVNLSLLQSFVPNQGTYFNFNGVSWTLSVEAFFYLMFPLLIWTFKRAKVDSHVVKSLFSLLVIWIVLFSLNLNLDESNKFNVWLLHIFPVARLFEFATGIILGLIFFTKTNGKQVVSKSLFSTLEIVSLGVFIYLLGLSTQFGVGAVRGGFFIPIWCLLIYIFAHQGGIFSKMLSNKYLVFLGEISFSFYMIHQLVLRYFDHFKLDKTLNFWICLGVALFLSAVMYQYFEEPLRKRIRFGTKKKDRIQIEASA